MKNLIFLFLSVVFFFSSCQKRDWNNPFDPECPKESWTPTDFAAKQQGNAINLTWVQKVKNISGFRIERKIEGETSWKEVVAPEKATNSWADQSITGGKLYEYRIVALAGGNESNFTTIQIRPLLTATITTTIPSAITATSAMLGGIITTDGGATVTEQGVCWATSTSPTTSNNKLAIGNGTGSFSNTISGLTANTSYYVRAYAINSQGTAYGNEVSFKTGAAPTLATLTTSNPADITSNSATLGGNVTIDGNASVTERGICYSTSQNPTTSNTKVVIGAGTGTFSNSITGLIANTTYYLRAYAINSQGTAYGNEVNFKTNLSLSLASLTTSTPNDVTTISATLGGNVTSDGNATVTERGVCYSTSPNPTTSNTKLAIGSGTGSFSNTITGLTANTNYYVRAYAINGQGTAYGNEQTFKTGLTLSQASLTTSTPTDITSTSATLGGIVTNDGNASVTVRGVCYSTSPSPTTSSTKVAIGSGTGTFSNSVTGLTANTTYYVRAYAINNQGTAYGHEQTFKTESENIIDIDGNIYHTVTIGTQVWMVENLRVTKYNDGTSIPHITSNYSWGLSAGYCWYQNDATNFKNTYGAIYSWFAINTIKLAPIGWHIPSDAEWTVLINFLGGENYAGGKLKESGLIHWVTPNTSANNESGFVGLPGGFRYFDGSFNKIGFEGYYWSSTVYDLQDAYCRSINSSSGRVYRINASKGYGYSVRCIKD